MSDTTAVTEGEEVASENAEQVKEQLVSQADVDRIVKERVARERAKYSDYDELKAKAAGSQTLEERLASLEGELTTAKATALRSDIAAKHGLSAEDRDLFLTGTDESTLNAQAQRLAEREADRKKQGNVAPKEGASYNSGEGSEEKAFASNLFGRDT
ncbi:hypothetical protein [Paenarthrobacter ilicis]|uniref:hypothetical protein n=1 Tax=Paenarthrobacter ilicis TaxID=43665 RepID=UPI00386D5419